MSERTRIDRLRIGDAIQCILIRYLCHRVEGSKQSVLLCSVRRVGSRRKWRKGFSSVRQRSGCLSVHNIGSDGQDRGRRFGIAVGVVLSDLLHEGLQQPDCDVIRAVVIVSIARKVALDLIVDHESCLVADRPYLCILDRGDGIHDMGEPGDTGCKCPSDIGIDECHLGCLIVVLVMHVLDQVQDVDIESGQPVQHEIVLVHDLIVVQVLGGDRCQLRSDLHVVALLVQELLILAAVDRIEQCLCKVCTRTKELHLLAGLRCGHTAADAVIVSPDWAHDIVILILNRGGVHRDLRSIAAEILRQLLRVQDGKVRLRSRSHILEGMQEAEIISGHHVTAVHAKARDLQGCPDRVTGEQLIVGRDSRKLDHTELHDQMVDQLLCLLLGDLSGSKVSADIDIQEGGNAADGHRRAVLRLDRSQVSEIQPLNGLMGILCRP